MAKGHNFAVMPSVSISRSKFKRTSQHKTTFNLGDIIPVYCDEVLPGDTRSISLGSLVRMSTPVVPIMDNIKLDFYAFFVPNRLCWDHWKEFMGENTASAGAVNPATYSIPKIYISQGYAINDGDLGDYFGLPTGVNVAQQYKEVYVSCLPVRAYRLIYNRWFRDQNIIAPVVVNKGDNFNSYDLYHTSPFKAAKFSDYFTRSLPYAQKGSPVEIPVGTMAIQSDGAFNFTDSDGRDNGDLTSGVNTQTTDEYLYINYGGSGFEADTPLVYNSGLKLSQVTAATINQLRFAFQYQKMLEKDALYGTRYWEILHAHFGVNAPDASLQDPEFLGHASMKINIDQVLQTSSTTDDSNLGQPGANSVSGFSGHLFTKSFCEHGYLLILAVARHDQTYGQGLNRMWTRSARTDFYLPVFANLGAQPVLNKEIFVQGIAQDDQVFGYQEAWAEYRYKPSIVSGLLKPYINDNLGFWTLANNFDELPTLSQSFIEQDRDNLSRCLVTGSSGPDFIADFYFEDIAVRPMPLYSIPGLVDHH